MTTWFYINSQHTPYVTIERSCNRKQRYQGYKNSSAFRNTEFIISINTEANCYLHYNIHSSGLSADEHNGTGIIQLSQPDITLLMLGSVSDNLHKQLLSYPDYDK